MKWSPYRYISFLKSATIVGIVSSLVLTGLVYEYYKEKNDFNLRPFQQGKLFKTLQYIEQKALDVRFLLRGPVKTTENVAVLAIDDLSIYQMGRWPWSRDLTANLVERLMREEAKALGFDMVFSEPQIEKTIQILDGLEKETPLPANILESFKRAKEKARPDEVLAATIAKYRDRLILGAFYEELDVNFRPYQDLCYNEAFKRTPGFSLHENEGLPLFLFNNHFIKFENKYIFENTPFEVFFKPIFDNIESTILKQELKTNFPKKTAETLNPVEINQVRMAQQNALQYYCEKWLNPGRDQYLSDWEKNWPQLMSDIQDANLLTFKQSREFIKHYFLENPVKQTGIWTVNIPQLIASSDHNAMFTAHLDSDGTIRQNPLFYRAGINQENYIPSLGFQTYLVAKGLQAQITLDKATEGLWPTESQKRLAVKQLDLVDPETDAIKSSVPVDSRGNLRINYAGPQMSFPYLSASELFHDRPEITIKQYEYDPKIQVHHIIEKKVNRREFIKDRIFILGVTAIAHYDLRTTPFEENYPGVETHANVLANLLSQNFLSAFPNEWQWMTLAMFLTGITISILLQVLNATWGFIGTGLFLSFLALADKYWLFKRGYTFGTIFLLVEVVFIYVMITAFKYFTEEKNKRYLKSTFTKYVSPAIVDEILSHPDSIQLGGRKQRLTVFFSDVRNFTTIAEKLDPQVLAEILNEYLTPMTNIVFSNKGTLDKYMGDAIMAFFGAPISFDDHASSACRCALESMRKLADLQVSLQDRGLPLIDIGIGINTADVSVGNMGSDTVRNYTVMGDGVNLASRLEGINKVYGTNIIIGEETYKDVADLFICREIDRVRVKGKKLPVRIFELRGMNPASEEEVGFIKAFQKAYELYHQFEFSQAREAFDACLQWVQNDPVSQLYISRCDQYIKEPPPADWDGAFESKVK